MLIKVAFGGGCHWCTEAVFLSLKGVEKVEQGWVSSSLEEAKEPSEAVIVYFDVLLISLDVLVEIHLFTHNSTSNHSFRKKYRSAVYSFTPSQEKEIQAILLKKAKLFESPIVTKVYPYKSFKLNSEKYLNYYEKNREKAFCKTYIDPKLSLILKKYGTYVK